MSRSAKWSKGRYHVVQWDKKGREHLACGARSAGPGLELNLVPADQRCLRDGCLQAWFDPQSYDALRALVEHPDVFTFGAFDGVIRRSLFMRALLSLPLREFEALKARYVDHSTFQKVGSHLGVSTASAQRIVRRALRRVRSHIFDRVHPQRRRERPLSTR